MIILSDICEVHFPGMFDGFSGEVSARCCVPANIFEEHRRKYEDDLWQLCRGRMSEIEFFGRMAARWHSEHPEREIVSTQGLMDAFYANARRETPEVLGVFKRILYHPVCPGESGRVEKGMPELYLVSDHFKEAVPKMRELHPELFEAARGVFWSCDYGAVKRDPGFFETVISEIGEDKGRFIFIDDSRDNIRVAEAAGLKCIRFENARQLETVLGEYGVVFEKG